MRLDDFHKMVSFEVRRGTALDGMIPFYTKQAVSFLERNWAMKYMEEWCYITLQPGDQVVDMIWSFRNFRFLRRPNESRWLYLNKRSPEHEELTSGTEPQSRVILNEYFQIGMRYVRFNVAWNGTGPLNMEGVVYKFSDWQTSKPDYRHFILDVGSDLLLFQTMLRIAASIKDSRMTDNYKPLRDEALKTFLNMDTDAEYEDSEEQVEYGGIYK